MGACAGAHVQSGHLAATERGRTATANVTGFRRSRTNDRPHVRPRTFGRMGEHVNRSALFTAAAAALALGFSATTSQAQLIVGNDQSGVSSIYDVNPTTGVATPIYTG